MNTISDKEYIETLLLLEVNEMNRSCKECKNYPCGKVEINPEDARAYKCWLPDWDKVLSSRHVTDTITADKRSEIIEYFYEFNVRADIKIEELVDDVISIITAY